MNHPDNGQRLLPPLAHMTKRQLWEMIDDEVKPFVQSCAFPKAFDGKSPVVNVKNVKNGMNVQCH